jgi:hypothetical protein
MLDTEISIANINNNKASGDDTVTVNMMKAAGPVGIQCIYRTMRRMWQ